MARGDIVEGIAGAAGGAARQVPKSPGSARYIHNSVEDPVLYTESELFGGSESAQRQ